MKNSSWKDNAELIGIAAIVASLIFVGLQLRLDRKIAVASVQAASVESFVAINELFQIRERRLVADCCRFAALPARGSEKSIAAIRTC